MNLKDKTVCITGASRGIGFEIVKLLLVKDAVVYGISRTPVPISHPRFHSIQHDLELGIPPAIPSAGIDILILNVGYNPGRAHFSELSQEQVVRSIRLNIITHLEFVHRFKSARVVFVNSVISMLGMPSHALYSASKAFISVFNSALEREGRDTYIVFPYKVNTGFFDEMKNVGVVEKEQLARLIVADVEGERKVRVVPWIFSILPLLNALLPRVITGWVIGFVEKILFRPHPPTRD